MQTIKVYTTNYCPYCTAAKRFLEQQKWAYEEINLEQQPELRMKLSQENQGWRTVPMIFVGNTFIGGYTDMLKWHQEQKLVPLVEST